MYIQNGSVKLSVVNEVGKGPPRRVSTSLKQVLTEFIESFHLTSQVC
jgi:hypothetical protein